MKILFIQADWQGMIVAEKSSEPLYLFVDTAIQLLSPLWFVFCKKMAI